ncbi:MAG: flagellar motor switch protein FliN [Brevinema sp.]
MSDTTLSQEELDSILAGSSLENTSNDTLSNAEEINLSKLANELGTNRATILSQLTNKSVVLDQVNIITGTNIKITEDLAGSIVGSSSGISGTISGAWNLFSPEPTVLKITNAMLGSENNEITPDVIAAFGEVISNSLSADVTFLSTKLKATINPEASESLLFTNPLDFISQAGIFIRIGLHFLIDGASFPFYICMPIRIAKNITKIISTGTISNPTQENNNFNKSAHQNTIDMQSAQFQQFAPAGSVEPLDNLALLLDVPMRVTVELGRTRITIKDILNLGEGSIIELEKLAGEPVDVLVNDKLIALGEVVVIDENFSVRITKVITPMERIFDRENLHGKGGI